jgi:hypothetical protein
MLRHIDKMAQKITQRVQSRIDIREIPLDTARFLLVFAV